VAHVVSHSRVILVVALSAAASYACTQESRVPDYIATVVVDATQQEQLVSSLDSELKAYSLKRYGAAPGLKELAGREVLFMDYRRDLSEKWSYLTATDIIRQGVVEVRVYPEYLPTGEARDKAFIAVGKVLAQHGSKLQPNPRN
jgi:hypothetical protein